MDWDWDSCLDTNLNMSPVKDERSTRESNFTRNFKQILFEDEGKLLGSLVWNLFVEDRYYIHVIDHKIKATLDQQLIDFFYELEWEIYNDKNLIRKIVRGANVEQYSVLERLCEMLIKELIYSKDVNKVYKNLSYWLPNGLSQLPVLHPSLQQFSSAVLSFNTPNANKVSHLLIKSQNCLIIYEGNPSCFQSFTTQPPPSISGEVNLESIKNVIAWIKQKYSYSSNVIGGLPLSKLGKSNLKTILEMVNSSNVGSPPFEPGKSNPSTNLEMANGSNVGSPLSETGKSKPSTNLEMANSSNVGSPLSETGESNPSTNLEMVNSSNVGSPLSETGESNPSTNLEMANGSNVGSPLSEMGKSKPSTNLEMANSSNVGSPLSETGESNPSTNLEMVNSSNVGSPLSETGESNPSTNLEMANSSNVGSPLSETGESNPSSNLEMANSSNVGSPLPEPAVESNPSTILEMGDDWNDPDPYDMVQTNGNVENTKQRDFLRELNLFVMTLTSGSALVQAFSDKTGSPQSSPVTFHAIAAMNGFTFSAAFLSFIMGDEKSKLAKSLASAGAAGVVLMTNVTLGEYFLPDYAIPVGVVATLLPLYAITKRVFSKQ